MEAVVNMCVSRVRFCRSYVGLIRLTRSLSVTGRLCSGESNQSVIAACNGQMGTVFHKSTTAFCRSLLLRGPGRGPQLLTAGRSILRAESPACYSSEQKQSTGSLTDDILKAKMPLPQQSAASSPQPADASSASNKKSDKSDSSWFSSKNAWKLGLLSLAGMGVLMFGNVLLLWGMCLIFCLVFILKCMMD